MVTWVDITLASIAGGIYFGVFRLYNRIPNNIKFYNILLAVILDWYPVYSGDMVGKSLTPLILAHVIITVLAYAKLVQWAKVRDKGTFKEFFELWVVAYVLGWFGFLEILLK